MTGLELRAHRRAKGLSQQALSLKASVSRDTVRYWEAKAEVDLWGWAPRRLLDALGMKNYRTSTRVRAGWSDTLRDKEQERLDRRSKALLAALREKLAKAAAVARVRCGARTRKGAPCRSLSEPGRRRCRFHGGRSTGPRTQKGRERIAEAQRRRWERWRQEREI